MKKLCLILTVLYAIWANCSAQSLNLLDSNSSTFESGSSSWTCYDNDAWSIASESGHDGKCLKLTNTGAVNDYDKQMESSLSGHTPANRTRYVIKFWAKRNGTSGNGQIKVLLQKNNPDEKYPQIAFGGTSISIADTWKQYEYDLTTDRGDYEVIKINFGNCGEVLIDDIEFGVKPDNVARTINVDGKDRRYWLYVPASVAGKTNVPVVFSLHGRGGTGDPNADNSSTLGKPTFTALADKEGFIVVYPQGRDGGTEPNDWNNGFVGTTGWEATGKENADTKFIKAIVDEIKTIYNSNCNISVDPKKFYLCGFSMGGMMTYACAKVLNGTFAAYGSCGGFPLNEFHLNLATKQPIPFIHMHGSSDNMLGIKHLHTIIENLLFRNGCSLAGYQTANEKQWTTTKENGETHDFKRYDFTGVNGVPVTTVTFKDLWHSVEESAPKYLWDFFSKTSDTYKPTTMK